MALPTPYYDHDGITLYCGDAQDILPSLADSSIDFVFTDPPYGHRNNDGDLIHNREKALGEKGNGIQHTARPIANDGPEANELVRFAFAEFNRLLKPGCCCCCCCCGGGGPDPQFARWSLWLDEAVGFKQMVVWDKGPIGMGWHYRRSYETVLVGEKPGAACRWFDETSAVENIIRHIPKIIPDASDHPTPKPIGLVSHFIRLHTKPRDIILEPFAGGGTTLRSAKTLGRQCIGIEISEEWCRFTVERLSQEALRFE